LLCPKREYEWIPQWDCEILFSESGFAELDCVFTTNFPNDMKETWVVDKYKPNRLIQFSRFSESQVIRHLIELFKNKDKTTITHWHQSIISLNEAGNNYINNLSISEFQNEIKLLEIMLNYFLKTNKMIDLSDL
jgi:hypothetical protein